MDHNPNRTVIDLFGDVVVETSTLFRKEVQLAKAEISEKIGRVGGALSRVGIGAVFMIAALVMLLQAIVEWLAFVDIPYRWGALAVGLVVAIIGYILLRNGMNDVSASNLTPHRTAEQMQRNVTAVREKVR
ncbi:phage holin family protein [Chthonobacter albigriseus]|uniref:phage holin family protein n=1 Tax=Chthonobacter albigriseus TaxID=1683161 RepID=UPI0015EEBA6F|nr:phage holin family protein [Chthonobacter albigriseus]